MTKRLPTLWALGLVTVLVPGFSIAAPLAGQAADAYDTVTVDVKGRLHILTRDGRRIVPVMDSDQVGVDKPAISADRRSVGWLALFPNCCTSYPIPLKLVVYVSGTVHSFVGTGLPIWRWCFDSSGTHVAFYQETVHGGIGGHYELRDLSTARLIDDYDPQETAPPPAWVAALDAP
jgi:hypothetical protein